MNTDPNNFFDRLNEIKELYVEVKEAIILAENFDPSHDVYLSPLNELRNSLDHIMRSLIYPDKLDNELDEAKEHLYRAGYDAYEVLAINVGSAIIKNIERYNAEIISSIFPTYYTEIKPRLVDSKVELADARAHKRLNPETGTKSFTPYKEKVTTLIKQLKNCDEHIPDLESERKKRRNRNWLKIVGGILIGVIVTIAGTYLYDRYFKPEKRPENTSTQQTEQPKK